MYSEVEVPPHYFTIGNPVVPAPVVEETVLSTLSCLGILVENQLTKNVWVYF